MSSNKNDNALKPTASSPGAKDDALISEFLSFTGSEDVARAASYLEMSGGNIETAVSLFMEHSQQGGDSGAGGGVGADGMGAGGANGIGGVRAPDETRTERLLGGGGGRGGGINHGLMLPGILGLNEDMMMHSLLSGAGTTAAAAAAAGETATGGEVNAFGAAASLNPFFDARAMSSEAAAAKMEMEEKRKKKKIKKKKQRSQKPGKIDVKDTIKAADLDSVDDDSDDDDYDYEAIDVDSDEDDDENRANGSSHSSAKVESASSAALPQTLAGMFSPPSYVHRAGGFQGARAVARDARRWLLVNLQSDAEFACHALNRDVWNDELVTNLIQEGFIFWQSHDANADGRQYVDRYHVHSFPHVAILDPRTGRSMWKKEGWTQVNPLTPSGFAEIAADFCSRHSFDKAPMAPHHKKASSSVASNNDSNNVSTTTTSGVPGVTRSTKRPIHELSEEQQLQEAIRASMMGADNNDNDANAMDEDEDEYVMEDDDDDHADSTRKDDNNDTKKESVQLPAQLLPRKKTMADEFANVQVGDEPPAGKDVTRIQIRLPDGSKIVRRFCKTDPLEVVYAFCVQTIEDAGAGRPFELLAGFPPKDLYRNIEQQNDTTEESATVESCGLGGGSISVRWN
mmetsp:Transcript_54369/g.65439  ORF Transcript_54369/g.65439 Transcript_54369/m.65439 type:complete len:627 (+) Transcript_54369:36-1916(+)